MPDFIQAPKNDTELKAHRQTYHNRQLFHLYAVFLFTQFETALSRGLTLVFSWDADGKENFIRIEKE